MKVCNIENVLSKKENEYFVDMCKDAGGALYPIDFIMDFTGYHRTFRMFPFCKPDSCKPSDTKLLFDHVFSSFIEDDGEKSGKFEIKGSFYNSCDEKTNSEVAIKQKKGKVFAKSCKWLKNRPKKLKNRICSKKKGLGKYGPAHMVCPLTCCTCPENGDNEFLRKFGIDKHGSLRILSKDCAWLQNASKNIQKAQCKKMTESYVGGYPPAYLACPQTCGCSA